MGFHHVMHIMSRAGRAQCMRAIAGAALAYVPLSFAQAPLKTVTWNPSGSPYNLSGYDCAQNGVGTIFIQGTIELVHPNDKSDGNAPEILLQCDDFIFIKDSKIIVTASLYIRGEKNISGNVNIENVRGSSGADGMVDPAIYLRRKEASGADGGRGGNGDDAEDISFNYPSGRNADNGGEGGAGARGSDGTPVQKTSDGRIGTAAASVTMKARNYGAETTVLVVAKGGRGGKGADGGTGHDGGDGGIGGIGGKGGNAALGRTAGDGGRGGRGGDGGNGGQGGPGGNGGNGGRGGDARVYIISDSKGNHGNPPSDWTYYLDGGEGGKPGIGGPPGRYGEGKQGGFGGCGGKGSSTLTIVWHPDGSCGGQGPHGKNGVDGQPGVIGAFGDDGDPGKPGDWKIGFVVEEGGH